jgi:hypothetical protein
LSFAQFPRRWSSVPEITAMTPRPGWPGEDSAADAFDVPRRCRPFPMCDGRGLPGGLVAYGSRSEGGTDYAAPSASEFRPPIHALGPELSPLLLAVSVRRAGPSGYLRFAELLPPPPRAPGRIPVAEHMVRDGAGSSTTNDIAVAPRRRGSILF